MNSRALDRVERGLTAVALCLTVPTMVAITAVVLIAIVFRYVFNAAITYSFDLTTLLFCWMVFVGLIIGERDGAHLNLDLLRFALPESAERWVVVLRHLLSAGLCLFIAWIGFKLTLRTGMEIPSMRISQKWLYAALPTGFALFGVIYALRMLSAFNAAVSRESE
jgi:TRAP-type C4-dicarboxylate transport system permease small subunit